MHVYTEYVTSAKMNASIHGESALRRTLLRHAVKGIYLRVTVCSTADQPGRARKANLEESLDFYCQGELMEGDNQYFCEEVGKKVRLPAVLLLLLATLLYAVEEALAERALVPVL